MMENSFFEGISDGKKIEHHYETGFGCGRAAGITFEVFKETAGYGDSFYSDGQCQDDFNSL